MSFELDAEHIAAENRKGLEPLEDDYGHLGRQLARRGLDIEPLTARAMAFRVAVPSWGVGTGGDAIRALPRAGRAAERVREARRLRRRRQDWCG